MRGDGPGICRRRHGNRLDPAGGAFHQRARRLLCRHAAEIREKPRGSLPRPHPVETQRRTLGQRRPQGTAQSRTAAPDRDEDQEIHASRSATGPKVPGHGTGEQYKRRFCAGWQRSATTANSLANAAGAAASPACRYPAHPKTGNRRPSCAASRRSGSKASSSIRRRIEPGWYEFGGCAAAKIGRTESNTPSAPPARRRIMWLYAPGRGRRSNAFPATNMAPATLSRARPCAA